MKHSVESMLDIVSVHKPDAWATGTHNSAAIDTIRFSEEAFFVKVGTVGSGTVTVHIEESDDGSTGWTNITGATTATLSSDNDEARIALRSEVHKRYIRAVAVVATGAVDFSVDMVKTVFDQTSALTSTWIKPAAS